MTDSRIASIHLQRRAMVYIRQSTPPRVENHREPTRRQYVLAERARDPGWHADQVTVIDEDLGLPGGCADGRSGFAHLTAEVALGGVGILLGLEVSRLANKTPTGTNCHMTGNRAVTQKPGRLPSSAIALRPRAAHLDCRAAHGIDFLNFTAQTFPWVGCFPQE